MDALGLIDDLPGCGSFSAASTAFSSVHVHVQALARSLPTVFIPSAAVACLQHPCNSQSGAIFSTPLSCFRVLSFILTFELLDIYWEDCLEIRNQYDVIRLYQQHAECTTSINEHCFESQPAEVPYLPRKWALRVAPKILWEFTGVSGARRSVCFC